MQSLKLKSQTLIKIFGKDTIEVKELENMNELMIVGEGKERKGEEEEIMEREETWKRSENKKFPEKNKTKQNSSHQI